MIDLFEFARDAAFLQAGAVKRTEEYGCPLHFDGPDATDLGDRVRLSRQHWRVWHYVLAQKGRWLRLVEIAGALDLPEQSVSARLRDFRKERFGAHTVDRRRSREPGVYEYRVTVNPLALMENAEAHGRAVARTVQPLVGSLEGTE